MKKLTGAILLILAALPVLAQQIEENWVVCVESAKSGYYAWHKTLPVGTELVVTHLVTQRSVIVLVTGKIQNDSTFVLEISSDAGKALGISEFEFFWASIKEIPRTARPQTAPPPASSPPAAPPSANRPPAVQPSVPPRWSFSQIGIAVAQPQGLELNAFHPTLPIGSKVKLTSANNGRNVVVTISGRIKVNTDHIIEISRAAALILGIQTRDEVLLELIQ